MRSTALHLSGSGTRWRRTNYRLELVASALNVRENGRSPAIAVHAVLTHAAGTGARPARSAARLPPALAEFARSCKAAARAVSLYPGQHPAIGVFAGPPGRGDGPADRAGPSQLAGPAGRCCWSAAPRMPKPDPAVARARRTAAPAPDRGPDGERRRRRRLLAHAAAAAGAGAGRGPRRRRHRASLGDGRRPQRRDPRDRLRRGAAREARPRRVASTRSSPPPLDGTQLQLDDDGDRRAAGDRSATPNSSTS